MDYSAHVELFGWTRVHMCVQVLVDVCVHGTRVLANATVGVEALFMWARACMCMCVDGRDVLQCRSLLRAHV